MGSRMPWIIYGPNLLVFIVTEQDTTINMLYIYLRYVGLRVLNVTSMYTQEGSRAAGQLSSRAACQVAVI